MRSLAAFLLATAVALTGCATKAKPATTPEPAATAVPAEDEAAAETEEAAADDDAGLAPRATKSAAPVPTDGADPCGGGE